MKTELTAIEWADYTFNPWRGCTKVSPGCAHCYAETLSLRNPAVLGQWGKDKPRVLASEAMWQSPLKWNAQGFQQVVLSNGSVIRGTGEQLAALYLDEADMVAAGSVRPRVFCASLADWLDAEVPTEWLARLLELIALTPNLDWLLLTKRPQHWRDRIEKVAGHVLNDGSQTGALVWAWKEGFAPPNIWLGTSVENQATADERIPLLLDIPARVRWLSCEPLLGAVDFTETLVSGKYAACDSMDLGALLRGDLPPVPWLDWIIAGGESGPQARAMHPDWARSLRDQCKAAGVPFLFKQWGEWLPGCQYREGDKERLREQAQHSFDLDNHSWWVGKKNAGRTLDGRTHNDFPLS